MSISNLTLADTEKSWADISVDVVTAKSISLFNGDIVSGQFIPVLSNFVNITSTTNLIAWYSRVGRTFIVYVGVEITELAINTLTTFDIDMSGIPGFTNAFNVGASVSKDQPGVVPPGTTSIPGTGVLMSGSLIMNCSYISSQQPPSSSRFNVSMISFGL